jgi:hypothetical protein
MKKYECPYCHKKTFSLFHKFIAGGMASKGVVCPECKNHCVHGLKSTIFNSVVMGLALIYAIIVYVSDLGTTFSALIVIVSAFFIGKIFNAAACELEKNNRNDV